MKCVGFEKLINYLDGHLLGGARQQVEDHLQAGCQKCAADRQWYERVRQVMTGDRTVEPPPWAHNRAIRLFEADRPGQGTMARAARGVVRLLFDSLKQPALAGVRSSAAAGRQLLYAVDDYNIDLQVAASGQSADLIGQVLNAGEPGFDSVAGINVNLARAGEKVRATTTDDIGIFILRQLDAGEYDLLIEARNLTINVVGLPVSASP